MKVLVISVRGLHAGFLGCYGNEWIETPTLDSLASEGVVFDQHYAEQPEAAAARRSWRTGRYQLPSMPKGAEPDLLEILRAAGITTHLVVDGSRTLPPGFEQGWDAVTVIKPKPSWDQVPGLKHREVKNTSSETDEPLEATLSAVVQVLDGLFAKSNWLVWVDLATLVPPWNVPDEYSAPYFEKEPPSDHEVDAEEESAVPLQPIFDPRTGPIPVNNDEVHLRLQYSYASAVTFLDAGLEALIEEIGNLGLGDEIVFMLTSDHGVPLGEHGIVGSYRPWLHDELIHVPLLLSLPNSKNDIGRRISALTQSCDIMPTLLNLFGQAIPTGVHGHSLLPLARGQASNVRPLAVSGLEANGGLEFALRIQQWAYLLPMRIPEGDPPRSPQLYAKPEDRWEVNNLIQHHLELADEFDKILRDFINNRKFSDASQKREEST